MERKAREQHNYQEKNTYIYTYIGLAEVMRVVPMTQLVFYKKRKTQGGEGEGGTN